MPEALKRSFLEFSKRVFLDRLTTDEQKLWNPADIYWGPGNEYEYAMQFDPFNLGQGTDCSALAGVQITAAMFGPDKMRWDRIFNTETFPASLPGFKKVSKQELLNNPYPIKVCIERGGGGENSHMNVVIDGWLMESNGSYGVCTDGHGGIPQADNLWTDFYIYDAPITEDTEFRQQKFYPKGLDYAGSRIRGSDLKQAGVDFVCRYLSDGGPGLPGKQLLPDEFSDLVTNGVDVVFNWQTNNDFMLRGFAGGVEDARIGLAYIRSLPGGPQNPVIYFSADWDANESQQNAINDYLRGAASVLGGKEFVGLYGGYYVVRRAIEANVCKYFWQTQAWSNGNTDSRVNIVQRNKVGYVRVAGVECDLNKSHTPDIGAFSNKATVPQVPPVTIPAIPVLPFPDAPLTNLQMQEMFWKTNMIYDQICGVNGNSWPQLGADPDAMTALLEHEKTGEPLSPIDTLAWIKKNMVRRTKPLP